MCKILTLGLRLGSWNWPRWVEAPRSAKAILDQIHYSQHWRLCHTLKVNLNSWNCVKRFECSGDKNGVEAPCYPGFPFCLWEHNSDSQSNTIYCRGYLSLGQQAVEYKKVLNMYACSIFLSVNPRQIDSLSLWRLSTNAGKLPYKLSTKKHKFFIHVSTSGPPEATHLQESLRLWLGGHLTPVPESLDSLASRFRHRI